MKSGADRIAVQALGSSPLREDELKGMLTQVQILGARFTLLERQQLIVDFPYFDLDSAVIFADFCAQELKLTTLIRPRAAATLYESNCLALVVDPEQDSHWEILAQLSSPSVAVALSLQAELSPSQGVLPLSALDTQLQVVRLNLLEQNSALMPREEFLQETTPLPPSELPESLQSTALERLVDVAGSLPLEGIEPSSTPMESSLMMNLSEVLRSRDERALKQLAESTHRHAGELAGRRIEAIYELSRGHQGVALRRLHEDKAKAVELDESSRCRASLALAVALSATRRPTEALLEAVEALMYARRGEDVRGQEACQHLLARLCFQSDRPDLAIQWQRDAASSSLDEPI